MTKEIKRFLDLIPDGKENAIKRSTLVKMADMCGFIPNNVKDKDRYVRKLIAQERENNVIIAKPTGGYYVPTIDDATELCEYVSQEKGRWLNIKSSLIHAERVLEDMIHQRIKEVERR